MSSGNAWAGFDVAAALQALGQQGSSRPHHQRASLSLSSFAPQRPSGWTARGSNYSDVSLEQVPRPPPAIRPSFAPPAPLPSPPHSHLASSTLTTSASRPTEAPFPTSTTSSIRLRAPETDGCPSQLPFDELSPFETLRLADSKDVSKEADVNERALVGSVDSVIGSQDAAEVEKVAMTKTGSSAEQRELQPSGLEREGHRRDEQAAEGECMV